MYKGLAILYFVCFALYLLYSREPDFIEGETTPAIIHFVQDSATKQLVPMAIYEVNKKQHSINVNYVFRKFTEQQKVQVIYNSTQPNKAALYNWWGYFITWGELLMSIILFVALFKVATSITSNPTAEALQEQLEHKQTPKRKYD